MDIPHAWLNRCPRSVMLVACVVLTLLAGVIDYATGIVVSVTVLYLLPIGLSAWFIGRRAGHLTACACTVVWALADALQHIPTGMSYELDWNMLMLGAELNVVAFLLSGLKHNTEQLEQTILQRTEELRRAQIQLIESAKTEVIGRLVAGIAHEVKNPLMTLSLGVDYLLTRPNMTADEHTLVQDMKEAVFRASNTLNLLLTASRPSPLSSTRVDVNHLIHDALALVRHQLTKGQVTVVHELLPTLPRAVLDRTRIEHVLLNVLLNAIQAMPNGGTLTVRTSTRNGTNNRPSQLIIEIDDTGYGIKPEHLEKIFDSFFTTKPPGQGTGLGLSIVKRIMELHGGAIHLANRPDGGARATLTFNLEPKG